MMPMCGIGGFSLSPESQIKPRQLANSLLTALESRGGMASGFAYQDENQHGIFKDAVSGGSLSLKTLPKNAKNVILHTRLATHGSVEDNRNNHPVVSPDAQVALVHNGVIYNHESVRLKLNSSIDFDVDTAVIPALIEEDLSLSNLEELSGDAAIAWFDARTKGILHLGRLEWSPLVICQLSDGSTIFASTESLLWDVLIQLDLDPDFMETVSEYTYYQLRDGRIITKSTLPQSKYASYGYGAYDYGYYRHQTAGGKKQSYYDMWEDDDDELAAWNASFRVYDNPQPTDSSSFYIQHRTSLSNAFDWTYYDLDEYDLFKSDIFYIKDYDEDTILVDYGRIDNESGVMTSYSTKEIEKEDVRKLGLVS